MVIVPLFVLSKRRKRLYKVRTSFGSSIDKRKRTGEILNKRNKYIYRRKEKNPAMQQTNQKV